MALIEANVAAKAGPARTSIKGETGRLCAFWSEELAATGHVWPGGSIPDFCFETTTEWTYATALGGSLEWPLQQYARSRGGWLIRLERAPGEYDFDFIPDGPPKAEG